MSWGGAGYGLHAAGVRRAAMVFQIVLIVLGVAVLGTAILPRVLAERPLSLPIVAVGFGVLVFLLPLPVDRPDPFEQGELTERLSELVLIVSLMGSGLKLDRPFSLRRWSIVWRLLGVTMVASIGIVTLLASAMLGLPAAAALLLAAALAPTDPVLASDVQTGPPASDDSPDDEVDEVRFALTAEGGLNDGLAFPFVNLAVAAAVAGSGWLARWALDDVVVHLLMGVLVGVAAGWALGWLVFRSALRRAAQTEGFLALGATLLVYGASEIVHGYGFLSVFIAGLVLRSGERGSEYHRDLHGFSEAIERLGSVALLILVGGAVVGGVLGPLTWQAVVLALLVVFVVRPATGWLGLLRRDETMAERGVIAFFGIRGMGSVYYLAYGLRHGDFPAGELLWATTLLVIVISVVIHGVAAQPVMHRLNAGRGAGSARRVPPEGGTRQR